MRNQIECGKYIILGILISSLIGFVRTDSQTEKPDTLRIITRHRQYRVLMDKAADMTKMTWSNNLEKVAASVVKSCPTSREALLKDPQLSSFGVNVGSIAYPTPMRGDYPEDIQTSIIDQWGAERSNYRSEGGCPSAPCDAWWQVIWSKASHVGCSLKNCGNKTIMVCIYNSRADPSLDHPFIQGKPCSACPVGFKKCEDSLCTSESQYPTEPDVSTGDFEGKNDYSDGDDDSDDANKNKDQGDKDVGERNDDANPYAGASGDQGRGSNLPDSASQLTIVFATSFPLLLLSILA